MASEEPIIRLNRESEAPGPSDTPVRLPVPYPGQSVAQPPAEPVSPPAESPFRLEVSPPSMLTRSNEPGLEQILPDSPAPAAEEDPWAEPSQAGFRVPFGWFVLVALILAAGLGWSLWQVKQSGERIKSHQDESLAERAKDEHETREAEEMIQRVEDTLRGYFSAGSIDELVPRVRHPVRVRPLMESWYATHPLAPDPFVKMTEFSQLPFDERGSFWRVRVRVASGRAHELYLEEQPDGAIKVGWETHVGYQPMPWDDFMRTRPPGSFDFRVTVRPDTFYSHEFADSSRWLCFRITAPKSEEIAYGYVDRQSPMAALLTRYFHENGGRPAQMILRLNAPFGLNAHRAVRIEELRSLRWLYVENPDGGS